MQLIYLDTSVWNVLSEQTPDATAAYRSFSNRDVHVALGLNAYFEMLRSFYGKRPDAGSRGKRLFRCVHQFLSSGVRIIKTWEELLLEESKCVLQKSTSISPFCDEQWQAKLLSASRDLASGSPHPGTQELLAKRIAHSEAVGNLALQNISSQPEMVSDLRSVTPSELPEFLNRESRGCHGRRLLAKYLLQIFPMFGEVLPTSPEELAARLLESTSNRVAHAIVRSDIYQNWRAARGKAIAIRRCTPDDSYHVVNAAYFDVFVTEDQDGQADAARHALIGSVVLVYGDRAIPFFEWLERQLAVTNDCHVVR